MGQVYPVITKKEHKSHKSESKQFEFEMHGPLVQHQKTTFAPTLHTSVHEQPPILLEVLRWQ